MDFNEQKTANRKLQIDHAKINIGTGLIEFEQIKWISIAKQFRDFFIWIHSTFEISGRLAGDGV